MKGVLKDKTIILVTHQVDFLHGVDLIVVRIRMLFKQAFPYFISLPFVSS